MRSVAGCSAVEAQRCTVCSSRGEVQGGFDGLLRRRPQLRQSEEGRVREVPIVVSLFFYAHKDDFSCFSVKAVSAVFDFFMGVLGVKLDLPADLGLEGDLHVRERVHVLDLDLIAELLSPFEADRDVGIDPQRSLFHVAIGGIDIFHDGFDGHGIGDGLFGGVHAGLGDDLEEGNTSAVVVDAGKVGEVLEHPGIVFEMGAVDAKCFVSPLTSAMIMPPRTIGCSNWVIWKFLGAIGIEVGFSVEAC